MNLSPVYNEMILYALVYHTQPGSSEVELITEKFFKSEEKAWKWFHKKHKMEHFIEPEAVPVTGFHRLQLHEDKSSHGVCADHD